MSVSKNCPKCSSTMTAKGANGLSLDICENCEGVWFDTGEFGTTVHLKVAGVNAVLQADGAATVDEPISYAPSAQPASMFSPPPIPGQEAIPPVGKTASTGASDFSCPVCNQRLSEYPYNPCMTVTLHGCPECVGIFIEKDNLEKLAKFEADLVANGGRPQLAPEAVTAMLSVQLEEQDRARYAGVWHSHFSLFDTFVP